MKQRTKNSLITVLRCIPFVLCIVFMVVYLFSGKEITAEMLLDFAPGNILLAAVFMVLLYAFKSLTIFFPLIVLNIAGGFIFPTAIALFVNSIGVTVELTVPYVIGKLSGSSFGDKLKQKHPKFGEMMERGNNNRFFMFFFLRVISCLPGDAVSMYLGASKAPFGKYLLGSFLGNLPGLVCATLLGNSITDPTSLMFWVSIGLTVSISIISFLVYFFWQKSKKKQTNK